MLQPAHPLVSTICIVWTEDLEHLRRRQYNVTTCRLVTSTLVNIWANFQSCARQQSSSQESRFTDVYLKPATQTDHAKKKNGAMKRKIFSLFLIKHTVVVNEQKIGTLKTGCLIEGGRLIQGCYILDQLYLTSNAFWNLGDALQVTGWVSGWVSEWVSKRVNIAVSRTTQGCVSTSYMSVSDVHANSYPHRGTGGWGGGCHILNHSNWA